MGAIRARRSTMVPTSVPSQQPLDGVSLALSDQLTTHRHALAEACYQVVADWQKTQAAVAASPSPSHYALQEFGALVDYLALYFRTGDMLYLTLFAGEKHKQLHYDPFTREEHRSFRDHVCREERAALLDSMRTRLESESLTRLEGALDAAYGQVTVEGSRCCRLLLIGDCLHLDVMTFLVSQCAADDTVLEPTFITSKNPVEARNQLRALAGQTFDVVFYSPTSYELSLPYAQFLSWRRALSSRRMIHEVVESTLAEASATLDLLARLFECPILVHNSANIPRHEGTWQDRVKGCLSYRARAAARRVFNSRLPALLAELNARTFEHLHLLNEVSLLDDDSEWQLGRMFYAAELQHPAELGRQLASVYRDVIFAAGQLLTRKLVVCDLDNTLWDGVIGEGTVRHFERRQRLLQTLRHKGVLLSINSKNDPHNVHWDGAVLQPDDFVHAEINWEPKVGNLRRTQQALNLKLKDFVFIDDRADERQLASLTLPEVLPLDATCERTWALLEAWAALLPEHADEDRTALYKQREERERFIAQQGEEREDETALYETLDITVDIRPAESGDLKRVVELINRTNQFNLCGTRTTFREVSEWHASPDHEILCIQESDKFGSNGIVCIVVVELRQDALCVPVFVLSCRVFGYGIETAVMNHIKRAHRRGDEPILGHFQVTPHNQPCHSFYEQQGFELQQGHWVFRGTDESVDPAWLTVRELQQAQ